MNLPKDREAEVGVIGVCLASCLSGQLEGLIQIADQVQPANFYHDDCGYLYQVILNSLKQGKPVDAFMLQQAWKAGPFCEVPFPVEFWEAQDKHPEFLASDRIGRVVDAFRRRKAALAAHSLMEAACDLSKGLESTISDFNKAFLETQTRQPPIMTGKDLSHALISDLEARMELQGRLSGYDSGFPGLNNYTDGIQPGEMWIIAARPNVGKTAFSLNVASQLALKDKIPILYVSLEMSATALMRRMLSDYGSINGHDIKGGRFTEAAMKATTTFTSRLSDTPFHVINSPGGIKITQLCFSVRAAIRRFGIKVVFVDYLQKIRGDAKAEKRTYEIGDVSSELVALAKSENVNMFCLAQLNRESEKEKGRRPKLADLADSKSIEADADFVGLLERPFNDQENKACLRVAKQRDGERGEIILDFNGRFCRFTESKETREIYE